MLVISSNDVLASNYRELLGSLCATEIDVAVAFGVTHSFTFLSLLSIFLIQRCKLHGKI